MSPSASDVSVITVNWNGRDHLAHLLPSLVSLSPAEIIVVDNGSTDGSVEFVRSHFPVVRLIVNSSNRGFAHPNNQAAEGASGRFLAFINNDMRADSGWLKAALAGFEPGVACVASRILDWEGQRIDYNGSSLQYLGYALQKDIGRPLTAVSSEARVLFPCGGAMLIERPTFLQVGGFDEEYFAIYEDVDLGWRLWLSGHEVAFAPDSLVYHRGHATFATQPNEKMRYLMHRNALRTILKNYEEETVRRLLPLTVLLTIKRAIRFTGVDRESFYLWSDTRSAVAAGDPGVAFRILDAFNQLVALDDVLESLPALLEKRRAVQALRRRTDAEIIALFGDPLRKIVDDPDYLAEELQYLDLLEFDRLFDLREYRKHLSELPASLGDRICRLREQLNGLQWLGGAALMHPPQVASGRPLHRLLALWRRHGLRGLWRRWRERMGGRTET